VSHNYFTHYDKEKSFSLNDLQHICAKSVEQFIEMLSNLDLNDTRGLVIAIGTGGTISMSKTTSGVGNAQLSANTMDYSAVLQYIDPKMVEIMDVQNLDTFNIDSSQFTFAHVHDLVVVTTYIFDHLSEKIKQRFIGFVIFHGTDTLEMSSSYYAFQMGKGLPFPVVFTGAQVPMSEIRSDAHHNIHYALETVERMHKLNRCDAVVAFGNKTVLAVASKKVSPTNRSGFDSPVGRVMDETGSIMQDEGLPSWIRSAPTKNSFFPQPFCGDSTGLFLLSPVISPNKEYLKSMLYNEAVTGVVVSVYGGGTLHDDYIDLLVQLRKDRDIPVFSWNASDPLFEGGYESAVRLREVEIHSLKMSLSAIYAKFELLWRLHEGNSGSIIREMQKNFIGEVVK
jgi:L-asparaginase